MDSPTILLSNRGKIQIFHAGFTLCVNKPKKNNHTYLRCVGRDGPNKCKATASLIGPLEVGQCHMEWHHVERHTHEAVPMDSLLKKFITDFKTLATEKVDTPIQKIYEDIKLQFTARLSPSDRSLFLSKIPAQKNILLRAYRARASEFGPLPKTLEEVYIPTRFSSTRDGEILYRGKTEHDCHLFMSTTMCELLRSHLHRINHWIFKKKL